MLYTLTFDSAPSNSSSILSTLPFDDTSVMSCFSLHTAEVYEDTQSRWVEKDTIVAQSECEQGDVRPPTHRAGKLAIVEDEDTLLQLKGLCYASFSPGTLFATPEMSHVSVNGTSRTTLNCRKSKFPLSSDLTSNKVIAKLNEVVGGSIGKRLYGSVLSRLASYARVPALWACSVLAQYLQARSLESNLILEEPALCRRVRGWASKVSVTEPWRHRLDTAFLALVLSFLAWYTKEEKTIVVVTKCCAQHRLTVVWSLLTFEPPCHSLE
jgi:hypothetical protein